MKLRVLGCHGGELPGFRTTCLLIDEKTALDAGALTATLALPELVEVDDIFLTHSHLDHVKDVALLADLLISQRETPVRIRGTKACLDTIGGSLLNDRLWPDFTKLPNASHPVVELVPLTAGEPVQVRHLSWTAVPVTHPVDSVGYVIASGGRSIVLSGDTGPTEALWKAVNARNDVAALFVELSFPNELQWLADISGHLTPRTLAQELAKARGDMPVFLYHLKPAFLDVLRREVEELHNPRLEILELDDELEF